MFGYILNRFHNPQDIEKINNFLSELTSDYYLNFSQKQVVRELNKKYFVDTLAEPTPPAEGKSLDEVFNEFKTKIYDLSVRTWNPLFLNQMSAGSPLISVAGDMLASMLNPTLSTWEAAPAAAIIERNITKWMASVLGMPEGSSGIIVPGGSLANIVALTVARNKYNNKIAENGLTENDNLCIITSEASHYSIKNAANLLGIGTKNLITVKTNERNEILVDDFIITLNAAKQNKKNIFACVLIIGNTVTGGIDSIREIAEICKREKIHLHLDAAFGGSLAFTSQKSYLLDGIELADSICWDSHKWFYSPLTATALLFPDVETLKTNLNSDADYLFHQPYDSIDGTEDPGLYTILCGKKFDALKIWFLWKTYGTASISEAAESRLDLTRQFYNLLSETEDFVPSYNPVSPLMCFKFLPEKYKYLSIQEIDKIHKDIRERIKKSGEILFNIALLNGSYHFRTVLINPLTTIDDLRFLLDKIRQTDKSL